MTVSTMSAVAAMNHKAETFHGVGRNVSALWHPRWQFAPGDIGPLVFMFQRWGMGGGNHGRHALAGWRGGLTAHIP